MTTTDSLLADLADVLDRASKLATEMAATLAACPMHEPGDPDCRPSHGGACRPPVDMLREYRLPGGRVAYQEEAARWVEAGDWVQAVHGDEGRWEQVVGIINAETQTGLTTRSGDPRYGSITRVRWWNHDDKVRVATGPVPDPEPYR